MSTNPIINPQPNYSGVTIQISNPAVNLGQNGAYPVNTNRYFNGQCGTYPPNNCCCNAHDIYNQSSGDSYSNRNYSQEERYQGQSYPAQYYLNNYNYQTNGKDINRVSESESQYTDTNSSNNNKNNTIQEQKDSLNPSRQLLKTSEDNNNNKFDNYKDNLISDNITSDANNNYADDASNLVNKYSYAENKHNSEEQDFTKSTNIISDLDDRKAAIEAEKKNTKEKKIVALTDEYIKSLENYLNNPNNDIRLMASKEILTRLDEDKDRYNDAALNALLNKMLQDPSKLVRIAALSAFASQLASGNYYTIQLLHNIQNNPSADKEDVLQAADILLKMSAGTEIKHIPVPESIDNKGNKG